MRRSPPHRREKRTTDRGVSDLVAFILSFSIIIMSVAVVSVAGLGALENVRDSSSAESAQLAMSSFDRSMEDLRTGGVPIQSLEFELSGDGFSRLASTLRITITNDTGEELHYTVNVGALIRDTGEGTAIVYESGMLYRSQERGQVVLSEPPFQCGPTTALISLVSVRGDLNVSTVSLTLTAQRVGSTSVYPDLRAGGDGSAKKVVIDVSGTHDPEAWEQLFERGMPGWGDGGVSSDYKFVCNGITHVYVHNTTVKLDAIY